jgi:hypothetical protein
MDNIGTSKSLFGLELDKVRTASEVSLNSHFSDIRIKKRYYKQYIIGGKTYAKKKIKSGPRGRPRLSPRLGIFEISQDQQAETVKKGIAKARYNMSYTDPWIDDKLWTRISRTNGDSLPRGNLSIRGETVQDSDAKSVQQYTSDNRCISISERKILTRAAFYAARHLGAVKADKFYGFRTSSVEEAVDVISKNTNAGFPTFLKKNSPDAINYTRTWLLNLFHNKPNFAEIPIDHPVTLHTTDNIAQALSLPSVIFHRFQISSLSDDVEEWTVKIRQVWCIPCVIVGMEQMIFGDVLESVKKHKFSSGPKVYSTGMTNEEISKLLVSRLRNLCGNSESMKLYSFDYSKFDRTIPSYAFDLFFSILRNEIKLGEVHKKIFNLLRLYLKYTPFYHNGSFTLQTKGMPSGSLLTNFFDTWWNLTLWYLCTILKEDPNSTEMILSDYRNYDRSIYSYNENYGGYVGRRNDIALCGDDVLAAVNSDDSRLFQNVVQAHGMTVTHKKPSGVFDDVFFLGRWWDECNRPFQSESYMSSHIVFRTKWYDKDLLPFEIERLDLYRILSICLPFRNGRYYLDKTFGDYLPYKKWKNSREGYFSLKDWPYPEFEYISHTDSVEFFEY